jgi:polyisoprenoid-binding protein YceI
VKCTLCFLFAAAGLWAHDFQLHLDAAQTQVQFTLPDILHTVHGAFKLKQGELNFDPATGLATGTLVVDATSGQSGSDARDSRMNKNILESARFPEFVFTVNHFTGQFHDSGDSDLALHGIFRIHGADHEMDLPVHVHSAAGGLTAETQFAIPYVKWGMKNPSTLFLRVSDTVQIDIKACGQFSRN